MSTTTNETNATWYGVECNRAYRTGERYCNGSGSSMFTQDKAHAESVFEMLCEDKSYPRSVQLTEGNNVVRHFGVGRDDALRSMRRAWHARRRTTTEAA